MRVISQSTKFQLQVLLREITASLPYLTEDTNCGLPITICTISVLP